MTRLHLALAAVVGLATPLSAQALPEPPIGTPKAFTMPAVERVRLANGMTVAFVPFGSVPQTALMLNTFAGDLDAPGHPWLAAINADLAKQGAGGRIHGNLQRHCRPWAERCRRALTQTSRNIRRRSCRIAPAMR